MQFGYKLVLGLFFIFVMNIMMLMLRPVSNPMYIDPALLLQLSAVSLMFWLAICGSMEIALEAALAFIALGIIFTLVGARNATEGLAAYQVTLHLWAPVIQATAVIALTSMRARVD